MFTKISLENFKAFSRPQTIPLRPITLLFGANSSGKTSLLQTLLLLKQTADEAESAETVLLPKGKTVDLGSYKELIYSHDTNRSLKLGFEFTVDNMDVLNRSWLYERLPGKVKNLPLSCTFSFAADRKGRFRLDGYQIGAGGDDRALASYSLLPPKKGKAISELRPFYSKGKSGSLTLFSMASLNSEHSLIQSGWTSLKSSLPRLIKDLEAQQIRLEANIGRFTTKGYSGEHEQEERPGRGVERRLGEMKAQKRELENSLKRLREYSWQHFLEDTKKVNESAVLGFAHFLPMAGPFRTGEPRERPYSFGYRSFGEGPFVSNIAYLIGAQFRNLLESVIYLGPLREYPERHYIFSGNVVSDVGKSGKFMPDLLFSNQKVVKRVNDWLGRFEIGYTLKAKTVRDPDAKDVFTLRLVDNDTGIGVSPLDVGFGISQILPVLVQGIVAKSRVIVVEQPEIHLHPRLQAEFGSFLADCVKSKQQNQFIVETHSEHLILRLQNLIRKGVLKPEDVSVIFVSKSKNGAEAQCLEINDVGDFIDEWPGGFFPERLKELS